MEVKFNVTGNERKVLLKNFTGSSAFKGGARDEISK